MGSPTVQRLTSTRIPTVDGEFTLSLYENDEDDKDHLALICGEVEGKDDVLVRIHSECFTGDVLGSLRCDCGEQLNASMRRIAAEGEGILLYLRQEGRGIGLLDKLRAYDLQDEGYDTVEANLMLGHGADERDYSMAAEMLGDLNVSSVRLLTNNPEKIESLEQERVDVTERVPLEPHVTRHNADYLRTKVDRMRHLLDLGPVNGTNGHTAQVGGSGARVAPILERLQKRMDQKSKETDAPFVTLTYAQSIDGSIASAEGHPLDISGPASLRLTHQLRQRHDGILVGINTVRSDDPRLNVRHGQNPKQHPRPIVLDSQLRFPLDAALLSCDGPAPLIVTAEDPDSSDARRLVDRGALIKQVQCGEEGVCLEDFSEVLLDMGIETVMVEGGSRILTSFLRAQWVDYMLVTIAPTLIGGTSALQPLSNSAEESHYFPGLKDVRYNRMGEDLILEGVPEFPA